MPDLTLASASPRRKELLEAAGIRFRVLPSQVPEELRADLPLRPALEDLALRKAGEVSSELDERTWVLAADTVVVLDGHVLGKPEGRSEARSMLLLLSGRAHRVITAVALLGPKCRRAFSVETEVRFQRLSVAQIDWYTSLKEPYDKAGAYAIQGQGAFLVESIEGSYTNVVGLPMAETLRLLEAVGLTPWSRPASEDVE